MTVESSTNSRPKVEPAALQWIQQRESALVAAAAVPGVAVMVRQHTVLLEG